MFTDVMTGTFLNHKRMWSRPKWMLKFKLRSNIN